MSTPGARILHVHRGKEQVTMKVKLPIALIVVLAIALGYLMGTESGRQRQDVILVRLGRSDGDVRERVTDAVADRDEQITDTVAHDSPDA
jgi:hypothetical protein